MKQFSEEKHRDALLRRRIKFVVEKGAMARLFKQGSSSGLQDQLFRSLKPNEIASLRSRGDYDNWFQSLVQDGCWEQYSRNGLQVDRWAYFAKLINIVVYEIVSNRELFSETDWQRLRWFLHIPLDSNVFWYLQQLDPQFPATWVLKGMTSEQYWAMQTAARDLAQRFGIPPIWFEDAWSAWGEFLADPVSEHRRKPHQGQAA